MSYETPPEISRGMFDVIVIMQNGVKIGVPVVAPNHTHDVTDIKGLELTGDDQSIDLSSLATKNYVDDAIAGLHFEEIVLATETPLPSGVAFVGASGKAAREDHVHPLQESVTGNAGSADKFSSSRIVSMTGTVTAQATWTGAGNLLLETALRDISGSEVKIWRGIESQLPAESARTSGTLYFVREN